MSLTKFIPLDTNELSHHYHLDESIFILGASGNFFSILFHFSMKFMSANRIAPDGTPRFAASHLGLFCLPMRHEKDARLIWVNITVRGAIQKFVDKLNIFFIYYQI